MPGVGGGLLLNLTGEAGDLCAGSGQGGGGVGVVFPHEVECEGGREGLQ